MEKIELKGIIGYLPYNCGFISTEYIPISNTDGIDKGYKSVLSIHWLEYIDKIKIVLYPISSLYEKRLHKGKEIIPLVEMAYMIRPVLDWSFNESKKAAKTACGWRLTYDEGFYLIEEQDDVRNRRICNQYKLYDFLDELHIDYRGLIDRGLAVDINTL